MYRLRSPRRPALTMTSCICHCFRSARTYSSKGSPRLTGASYDWTCPANARIKLSKRSRHPSPVSAIPASAGTPVVVMSMCSDVGRERIPERKARGAVAKPEDQPQANCQKQYGPNQHAFRSHRGLPSALQCSFDPLNDQSRHTNEEVVRMSQNSLGLVKSHGSQSFRPPALTINSDGTCANLIRAPCPRAEAGVAEGSCAPEAKTTTASNGWLARSACTPCAKARIAPTSASAGTTRLPPL